MQNPTENKLENQALPGLARPLFLSDIWSSFRSSRVYGSGAVANLLYYKEKQTPTAKLNEQKTIRPDI